MTHSPGCSIHYSINTFCIDEIVESIRMNAERMGIQMNNEAVVGSLLGTAIGDALGLPYEGIAPARAARMLGEPRDVATNIMLR